jgi:hypothetical protein
MSGYIFALDSLDTLRLYAENGVYATKISRPDHHWNVNHLYTLGDYLTMRPGDLVFFFIKRKIYGVGRLVRATESDSANIALCNYPESHMPGRDYTQSELLWDEHDGLDRPWLCLFEPFPYFFKHGLDMDEVLDADVRGVVQALRVFERVSFVQMRDDEANLLYDLLVRRFGESDAECFEDLHASSHQEIRKTLATTSKDYSIDTRELIRGYVQPNGEVRSEAALEAWLIDQIGRRNASVGAILGSWAFVTHQVPASPHKPTQYMDRIDVLGWETRQLAESARPTINRFKVVEVKRDRLAGPYGEETIAQLMKYVDWITAHEAGGDYSMVDAYLIARDFSEDTIQYCLEKAKREFVFQRRPFVSRTWDNVTLAGYGRDAATGSLMLEQIYP